MQDRLESGQTGQVALGTLRDRIPLLEKILKMETEIVLLQDCWILNFTWLMALQNQLNCDEVSLVAFSLVAFFARGFPGLLNVCV